MWVSRDPEEPGECGRSFANLTLASSINSTMDQSNFSLGEVSESSEHRRKHDLPQKLQISGLIECVIIILYLFII